MKLTLNVGSGERTFVEYPMGYRCINYDAREGLDNVDVIGDVRELPYGDNHFDYILASDIVEHFPISATDDILREWVRVLKPGGTIEFRLPNLKQICLAYVKNKQSAKHTSWLLYGRQDYPGNFHYVAFDRQWFSTIIQKHGLVEDDYHEIDYNFEFKAKKSFPDELSRIPRRTLLEGIINRVVKCRNYLATHFQNRFFFRI